MRNSSLFLLLPIFAGACIPALAQVPFNLRTQQGLVVNGQTLTFVASGVGQSPTLTLTGTYAGNTNVALSAPQLLGNPEFSISALMPQPNKSFAIDITFTPTTTNSAAAQLLIPFVQTAAVAAQPPTSGTIVVNLSGVVPNLTVNYILPPNNNVTPIADGGTIAFPATLVKSSATATIVLANLGSGAGVVSSVAIAGAAFQLQGLGLFPAGFQAGSSTSFTVRYSPVNPGTDTGMLTITFPNHTVNINLTGTAISSLISYTTIDVDTATPVAAGQQITVPDTPIGVQRSISIQVQNTGTAPTVINSVSSVGAGLTVTDLPFLPITLQPGDSFTSTINFTPTQVGTATGTLTIGADRFRLVGNGIGAQLLYSYMSNGSTTPVTVQPPTGTILFSSSPLGQSSTATFTITNNGTTSSTLTSLGIAGISAASYTINNPTALPAVIAPKSSLSFLITFIPLTSGLNTANLLVNGQPFVLSGFGSGVPQLQSFQFTGTSGQVQPFTQPSIGLTINQPYPLPLAGQLTMTLNSNVFVSDPAVQFSTGGRTVAFSIPAGSTQAVFTNGATQVSLQTGTVAENINVGATFTTQGGSVVTPLTAPSITLTVGRSAPQLLSVALQTFTANSFVVNVTGYSTARNLNKINLQFSGASGLTLSGTALTIDVSQSAGFYYSSSASQPFGGFFSINIPITVKVTSGSTLTTLAGKFTLTATAVNDAGTSNSVSGQ